MTDFWIDFSGYCRITAPNRDSAEELLYRLLDNIAGIKQIAVEVDCIEEVHKNVQ